MQADFLIQKEVTTFFFRLRGKYGANFWMRTKGRVLLHKPKNRQDAAPCYTNEMLLPLNSGKLLWSQRPLFRDFIVLV